MGLVVLPRSVVRPDRDQVVRALCDAYELSRPTVRRAVAELVAAGLVFTVPQRGTYVAEPTGTDDDQDDAPDA